MSRIWGFPKVSHIWGFPTRNKGVFPTIGSCGQNIFCGLWIHHGYPKFSDWLQNRQRLPLRKISWMFWLNPSSCLGGVEVTRFGDKWTYRRTDRELSKTLLKNYNHTFKNCDLIEVAIYIFDHIVKDTWFMIWNQYLVNIDFFQQLISKANPQPCNEGRDFGS